VKRIVDKIWELHGEKFLSEQFPTDKIVEATEIIIAFHKQVTPKNIYKVLSAKPLPLI
jgi:hypothetical protein